MALPAVSIPDFPLPFHVPVEVHPCVVHLAVALPMVILLMELVNLVAKKRALGVFSFVLMLLLAVILFGAYLTGSADAHQAGSVLESGEVKSLFEAHKTQGIYLVYSALVLAVIKLLSVLIRKTPMRVIFLLFLIAFTALTINTAKKGKELVFEYGVNVKTAPASTASESKASVAAEPASAEAPKSEEAKAPKASAEEVKEGESSTPKTEEKPASTAQVPAAESAPAAEEKATPESETAPSAHEVPAAPAAGAASATHVPAEGEKSSASE
ncbi:DUF2231 domain-containing protein [Nitratifractor sp.]|uniref:DUF2231 domain-containing protein n=1 Tax=Nitratifractor sp. TaxID=2268144 RepID=UPI0025FA41A7|nr:DUF2231 domain-containing protein [Nitratifractor sp.]